MQIYSKKEWKICMIHMEKVKDKFHTYDRFIKKKNDRYGKKIKHKLHTYDRFIQK